MKFQYRNDFEAAFADAMASLERSRTRGAADEPVELKSLMGLVKSNLSISLTALERSNS